MSYEGDTDLDRADDFEYDMAHEAIGAEPESPPPSLPPPAAMHVADTGGDYGYDAAHDLA